MDKDFSRITRFPPEECGGIIVVKIYKMTVDKTTKLFKHFFNAMDKEKIAGQLVIITKDGVRIRGTSTLGGSS